MIVSVHGETKLDLSNSMLQSWLTGLLTNHLQLIESWVDSGEGVIFDGLTTLVASKNPMLAAVLTAYRDKIIAAGDTAVAQLLDQIIASLQSGPAVAT